MTEYISKEAAVDAGYLYDWYIASVGDEPPVWTDSHIDELLNDFIVIPKDAKSADVQPVKRGEWKMIYSDEHGTAYHCSNCKLITCTDKTINSPLDREEYFCQRCGADLRGEDNAKG